MQLLYYLMSIAPDNHCQAIRKSLLLRHLQRRSHIHRPAAISVGIEPSLAKAHEVPVLEVHLGKGHELTTKFARLCGTDCQELLLLLHVGHIKRLREALQVAIKILKGPTNHSHLDTSVIAWLR